MKTCNTCGETKELDDFHNDRTKFDGKRTQCKLCRKSYKKEWRFNNRGLCNATRKRHDARKDRALPVWHETDKVNALYALAKKIRNWGCDVHVDHYFPLHSPDGCGLHCFDNLQILHGRSNEQKGNTWPL